MHWMILPYRRYFDFTGRSRRKEYWLFVLFWVLLVFALAIGALAMIAGSLQRVMQGGASVFSGAGAGLGLLFGLFGLFFLGSLLPMIAVQVRRLHDLGVSGWWYLAYIVAGGLVGQAPEVGQPLNSLLSLGWIVWMCMPGTKGANRFGDDPKNPATTAEIFA
jgi:uncharacterized membrane protein YhaH (DUF805 family)